MGVAEISATSVLPSPLKSRLITCVAVKVTLRMDDRLKSTPLQGATSCATVKVLPATVIVPLRGVAVGATVKAKVPLYIPLVAEVSLIHASLLHAVHGHCASGPLICRLPGPPALGKI